jgi:hypothetical protein
MDLLHVVNAQHIFMDRERSSTHEMLLVQWTAKVVVVIQFGREIEHRTAAAARKRRVDIRNYFRSRPWVIYIWVSRVEQGCYSSSEQDSCGCRVSGATLEAQRLTQSPVIQPITIWYVKNTLEGLIW